MSAPPSILVTGVTGFIGARAAAALAAAGWSVRGAHLPGETPWRLGAWAGRADLRGLDVFGATDEELEALCAGAEACLHAAWFAEPGRYQAAPENLACVAGTVRLFEAFARAGGRRFVGIGTCHEYAFGPAPLGEDAPLDPRSLYAAAKAAAWLLLRARAEQAGVSFAWARLFWLYGPGEDPRRLVPHVIRALLQGRRAELTAGDQVRDFLHVDDVADALAALAGGDARGAFNVGSGRPVAVRDVAVRIGESMGRPDLLAFGAHPALGVDPACVVARPDRLMAETGWRPRRDLDAGLEETIAWWRTRP